MMQNTSVHSSLQLSFRLVLSLTLLCGALACGSESEPEVNEVRVEGEGTSTNRESVPSDSREEREEDGEENPTDEEAPPEPLFTRSRPLMGTVFVIRTDAPPQIAAPALRRAFAEIERLETVLSEWRDDSEISRINAQAGREAVRVSEDVFAVVKAGVDVSRWSEGAFDLSWAALRGIYDFRPGRQRIPSRAEVRPLARLVDWTQIELNEEARTVFLRREGMAIGTGGIAKGYALDRAGEILVEAGVENFMLFGGGQVQVHGQRSGRAWRVGIQHPRDQSYFGFLESNGGSLSTSGDYEHFFVDENGKRWHHILNPQTGLPVEGTVSVTLIAESGLYADALSTAAFVLGPERAKEMLERIEYEAMAVMLNPDCEVISTDNVGDALNLTVELEDGRVPGCEGS